MFNMDSCRMNQSLSILCWLCYVVLWYHTQESNIYIYYSVENLSTSYISMTLCIIRFVARSYGDLSLEQPSSLTTLSFAHSFYFDLQSVFCSKLLLQKDFHMDVGTGGHRGHVPPLFHKSVCKLLERMPLNACTPTPLSWCSLRRCFSRIPLYTFFYKKLGRAPST